LTAAQATEGTPLLLGGGAGGRGPEKPISRPPIRLFEVVPSDLPTYAAVLTGLSLIALTAIYIPARRAARLDPAEILRTE
jgi:hypothetical protein